MGGRMVGDVVEAPFPFTNLTNSKIRPAIVLAFVGGDDWILCELTTKPQSGPSDIPVTRQDMQSGRLRYDSWARVGRVHTLDSILFRRTFGRLTDAKRDEILQIARNLF